MDLGVPPRTKIFSILCSFFENFDKIIFLHLPSPHPPVKADTGHPSIQYQYFASWAKNWISLKTISLWNEEPNHSILNISLLLRVPIFLFLISKISNISMQCEVPYLFTINSNVKFQYSSSCLSKKVKSNHGEFKNNGKSMKYNWW